jgi:signal transduction histidine kinase
VEPAFADKRVRLAVKPDRAPAPLRVDADRIDEVLGNLLDNALRHTPPEGRVEVGWSRHGDHVEISVVDSGEGIAPEHLARIFERFYRVDRARARTSGGSGIGLTIARAIVEAHGGRIWAASRGRGHGAHLVVRLPLAKARPERAPA